MSNTNEKLGIVIKKYRNLRNYSIQELAGELGVSTGFFSNLENARNEVFKLDLLVNLIEKLDIPISELLPVKKIKTKEVSVKPTSRKLEIDLSLYNIENCECIQQNITNLLEAYLDAIKELNYDEKLSELLTAQMINQLALIRNIKCS